MYGYAIKKILKFAKFVAYAGLAIFIWANFIGPEEFAITLGSEGSFTKEGVEYGALLLNSYLVWWTLATVILEVVDNLIEFVTLKQPD